MPVDTQTPPGVIGATIITRGRTYFDFEDPSRSEITIEDIAAGLSRECRYAGQLPDYVEIYSVAQHSVLCSQIVAPEFQLHALLHDAAEAYMGDLTSPLKRLCPDFKAIEKRVEAEIWSRFGLLPDLPPEVKRADYILLHTEKRDIQRLEHEWPGLADYPPMAERISPWSQRTSMRMFLNRYHQLTSGRSRVFA